MAGNITMAEIAKRVGVTRSAVSVVLSGRKSTIGVSDATRKKILSIAQDLNFKPNIFGRSLADQRSYSLALLCRECFSAQILNVIQGIQDVIYDRDYSLLTFYHGNFAKHEIVHLRRCMEKRVDGVIVMPALDPDGRTNIEEFRSLQKRGIPVVQVPFPTLPEIPAVTSDQYQSGRLGCRHLIELGHRRIVHLTFSGIYDNRVKGFYTGGMERAQGYMDEMNQAGFEPVIITHPTVKEIHEYVQHGEVYAEKVLNHPSRPTAAMTFNGYEAFGLLSGLRNLGIRVPEQISVLGYNTQEMDTMLFFNPALTAVVEPSVRIGQEAAQMVFDILEGRPITDRVLDQKLIVRASTGPPQER